MNKLFILIMVMILIVPTVLARTNNELFEESSIILTFEVDEFTDSSPHGITGSIILNSGTNPILNDSSALIDTNSVTVFGTSSNINLLNYNITDSFNNSICAWTKFNSGTGAAGIIGARQADAANFGEWTLVWEDNPVQEIQMFFEIDADPFTIVAASDNIGAETKDDTRQFWCGTFNQTDGVTHVQVFRNATLLAENSAVATETVSDKNFTIGGRNGLPTGTFNGFIGEVDEVMVFPFVMSQVEIEQLFNLTDAGNHLEAAVVDTTLPSFGADSINNTSPKINEDILVSQVVLDDTALNEARVSHNQSGTLVNQSPISISGVSFNVSDTITVTVSKGSVIIYQWHVDDTSTNANTSVVRTFTVGNTPPSDPIIVFPTASLRTKIKPLDLNVTFAADVDGDSITINYFINGTINSTSSFNSTFDAEDGFYLLEVSLDDGTDFSNNVSVLFEIDTTVPSFQETSINNSLPRINEDVLVSQIVIDNNALDFTVLAHNQSGLFVNQTFFDISGVLFNATNTITVTAPKGTVVAYIWSVNDTLDNSNISIEKTFTVQNTPPFDPIIIFPTAALRTNLQPLQFNVTFPADVDGDSININYFINGTINSTSSSNSTFTADDGLYLLEVSIDDGEDFSNNVSVLFELDTINPILTLTLPIDASTHSTDIPVDILCTDTNPFLLNYTFFNSTFEVIKSIQNSTPIGQEFIIKDLIDITGIPDGSYTFNTSCSDTHTKGKIPEYNVFDVPKGKRFITPNGVDVLIVQIGQPIGGSINAVRLKDRYTFEFGTTASRESNTFKVISAKNKIQIIDSEIKGHLIIQNGNDGNWIDFENDDDQSTVIVERINDKQVNVHVFSNDFNFNSIGGLNIVTESIALTIDTTVPPITGLVAFETTGTSGILVQAGAIALVLVIILGLILELVFRPLRSRFGKKE